jgi:glycosyltransferase involved in cell wall biosynthesis
VADFNRHLDGIGAMSTYVRDVLVAAGVRVPVEVTGNGVWPPLTDRPPELAELADLRPFRFLNIGSAFPRKGVDVLLRAYFGAFSGSDPVSLVLKTFPNPHNNVGELLDGLRTDHPDPPDVRWIDRDLPDHELRRLYAVASCYVHTSRGEGFGLPLAEAMLAAIPVIAVTHSGPADFCSDDTVLTVPYELGPAASHLSTPGSVWAEPDVDALAKQLRFMAEHGDEPEVRERAERARRVVEEHHNWPAAAQRWVGFLERLEEEALVPEVALVTPWSTRCGIAEYSRSLTGGFGHRVAWRVFADQSPDVVEGYDLWDHGDVEVVRCWQDRFDADLDELRRQLLESEADLVHVQFNFAFFELRQLGALFDVLQDDDRAVVITLHATHEPETGGETLSLRTIGPTLNRAELIIVHQTSDVERLAGYGITGNVTVIPMGAAEGGLPGRAALREALRLGDRPVVATFGFALPHKGTLELIRAVARLRERHPDVVLLSLAARHPDPISAAYLAECRAEVDRLDLADHVVLVDDFLSETEARSLLAAADVVALPYAPTPESASAALRFVIGVGAAVVTTRLPIFADASEAVHQVDSNDPEVLAGALGDLLADDELRRQVAGRCADYARSVSWDAVARQHAAAYRRVVRRRRASA